MKDWLLQTLALFLVMSMAIGLIFLAACGVWQLPAVVLAACAFVAALPKRWFRWAS